MNTEGKNLEQTHKIAIVILNYNGRHHLEKFLPSVISNCPSYGHIVVVDNCSTDDSIIFMREAYPEIELRVLEDNSGFAGGYAKALPLISAQYYLILNSDVELTDQSIHPIVEYMDQHDQVAACQPKIRAYSDKQKFEYAGACGGWADRLRYPFCRGRILDYCEVDSGQYDEKQKVFWCTGAAMFIRSEVYLKSGGFDPRFFAHMEEIDLCWRIQRMGYDLACLPQATVYHLGGGTLNYESPFKTLLNFRNSLAMILKNEPTGSMLFKLLARLILDGIAAVWMLFSAKTPLKSFWAVARAHFSFYAMIPYLLKRKRAFIQANGAFSHKAKLDGVWKGSIIKARFISGIKTFHQL